MERTKPPSVKPSESRKSVPPIKVVDDRVWLAVVHDTTAKYKNLIKKLAE